MKKSIIFRVDGDFGNKYGSGHIWRCLKIYKLLKKHYKKKYKYVFLTKKNIGSTFLKQKTNAKIILYNKNNKFLIKEEDIVIIDTLGADKNFIKYLNRLKIKKIISLEETDIAKYKNCIIINGIFFAKKKLISKSKKIKIFQGPKYIILDKAFSFKKKFKKNKNIIFIASGGNDKKKLSYQIIKKTYAFDNFKFRIILGKGVEIFNPILKIKKNKKIRLIKNKDNIYSELKSSKIAIVSGGTLMFESICCGHIPFVVKTYNNQKFAINYFLKKKLINYLGDINSFNKKKIEKQINNYNQDKKKFRIATRIIDGKGIFRFLKIFKELEKTSVN